MAEKKLNVPCPTCGKQQVWDSKNNSRPFCSERCKLIDLGEWASEGHRIPGEESNQNIDEDNSEQ